ncbi:MAG: helix-turn-helix transcriptional regulator [Clostridia bacterium]|nr:helix-turn-helix transcriptional regulator [Clostridia bacterium]
MTFGERLANLRKSKGLSQEQLAEVLDLTRQTISKWELDQSTPDFEYLIKLSDFYGVSTDYLIKGERSKQTTDIIKYAAESSGLKVHHVCLSLGAVVMGASFIGILVFVICSALRPWGAQVNGMYFEGLIAFLIGTKTLWFFIILAVLFVLGGVAFGYGVVKTFLGKEK